MKQYIAALDQGTTSSRCILFDRAQNIVSMAQKEFTQIYPRPGWVEHDPMEIYSSQYGVMNEALAQAGVPASEVAGIGITNQRETTVVWDRRTGRPVCNAIVWQCRRTAPLCEELKRDGDFADYVRSRTGLLIDAYFSATKIRWILDHIPDARRRAEEGELLFGTVDSWLIWKLTGGRVHVTDRTNASRTMLYDIENLRWDEEICRRLDIPLIMLPEVRSSSEIYGTVNIQGVEVSIAGIAGDQQAALFGQACFEAGEAKNTYGTGCFLLMNTGEKPTFSENRLLTTVAWKINGKVNYALEGSIFVGGSVVQWLRDGLKCIESSSEVEALAASVPDTGGVYFTPALTGLGAPYWDPEARGLITGISRGTTTAHIARAALEGIAFQTYDIVKAMERDSKLPIKNLKVDGGASRNNLLMQFQSNILNTQVLRPKITETTALGAAYLAGLAVGYWKDLDEIRSQWQIDREFTPSGDTAAVAPTLAGWHDSVKRTLTATHHSNKL